MPSIKKLLYDVQKKYPEMEGRNIGIEYESRESMKHNPYLIGQRPLEGWLSDSKGNPTDHFYMIKISDYMKHSDNLVKVGAISQALSSIHMIEKNYDEGSTLRKIGMILLGSNKFTEPVTYQMEIEDLEKRGLARPFEEFEKYVDDLKEIEILVSSSGIQDRKKDIKECKWTGEQFPKK